MSQTLTDYTDHLSSIDCLTESERHAVLCDERRRLTLDVLAERPGTVALSTVAAAVAAREDGCDASDDEDVRRVEVALHHTHLPKMDDAGVLDYRAETHHVVQ